MSPTEPTEPAEPTEDERQQDLIKELRAVRDAAREAPGERAALPDRPHATRATPALSKLPPTGAVDAPTSPDRADLNTLWNLSEGTSDRPRGFLGKLFSPIRSTLKRLIRFAIGPVIERQVHVNSAQVRFDNDIVTYVDSRLDRMGTHYDRVLGLHGKRMEEIDERHLILQQELVRHVHDLVERIEFVFETAETNHLQVDGALREAREELRELGARIEALGILDNERRGNER